MGWSEEKEDWLGNKYTQHYDDSGNKTGWSEHKEDWLGNEYTQHHDSDSNKTGWSEQKEDWLGNEYTQHHGAIQKNTNIAYNEKTSSTRTSPPTGLIKSAKSSCRSDVKHDGGGNTDGSGRFLFFVFFFCTVIGIVILFQDADVRNGSTLPDPVERASGPPTHAARPAEPPSGVAVGSQVTSGPFNPRVVPPEPVRSSEPVRPTAPPPAPAPSTAVAPPDGSARAAAPPLTSPMEPHLQGSPNRVAISPPKASVDHQAAQAKAPVGSVGPDIGSRPRRADAAEDPLVDAVGRAVIERLQASLAILGFDVGPVDGIMGPRTSRAIRAFEKSQSLPESGIVSVVLMNRLENLVPRSQLIVFFRRSVPTPQHENQIAVHPPARGRTTVPGNCLAFDGRTFCD
ncbi:peptidoglycan-binding domain-containing protein [Elioraea sp.]|uniref:peptidoglycan-binding domain-containing protein n=1 Tax=Elioraea sp. TaxID=2185103 RepID=UPI003F6F8512